MFVLFVRYFCAWLVLLLVRGIIDRLAITSSAGFNWAFVLFWCRRSAGVIFDAVQYRSVGDDLVGGILCL